jgi:hypothetical protein
MPVPNAGAKTVCNESRYINPLYKAALHPESGPMEKMTWLEILPEVVGLLDSLKAEEQRQVMAALAERYGLKMSEKATGSRRPFGRSYKRGQSKTWSN